MTEATIDAKWQSNGSPIPSEKPKKKCTRKCAKCLARDLKKKQSERANQPTDQPEDSNEMKGIEFAAVKPRKRAWTGCFKGTREF